MIGKTCICDRFVVAMALTCALGTDSARAGAHYEIWVADRGDDAIRVYDSTGAHIRSITAPELRDPVAVEFGPDGDDIFVANFANNRILRFDYETGAFAGTYIDDDLEVSEPTALLFEDDVVYVLNNDYQSISVHDAATGATTGVMEGGVSNPQDMTFGPDGNIYVTARNEQIGYVQVWDPLTMTRLDAFGGPLPTSFIATGITFTSDGDILVCDWSNSRVLRYDGDTFDLVGEFIGSGVGGLDGPSDIAFDPEGNLVVSNWHGGLHRFDGKTGAFIDVIVPPGIGGLTQARGFTFLVPAPNPCPADLADDGGGAKPDGAVNIFDLLELLSNWGTGGAGAALAEPSDLVDLFDLLELLAQWGDC